MSALIESNSKLDMLTEIQIDHLSISNKLNDCVDRSDSIVSVRANRSMPFSLRLNGEASEFCEAANSSKLPASNILLTERVPVDELSDSYSVDLSESFFSLDLPVSFSGITCNSCSAFSSRCLLLAFRLYNSLYASINS